MKFYVDWTNCDMIKLTELSTYYIRSGSKERKWSSQCTSRVQGLLNYENCPSSIQGMSNIFYTILKVVPTSLKKVSCESSGYFAQNKKTRILAYFGLFGIKIVQNYHLPGSMVFDFSPLYCFINLWLNKYKSKLDFLRILVIFSRRFYCVTLKD